MLGLDPHSRSAQTLIKRLTAASTEATACSFDLIQFAVPAGEREPWFDEQLVAMQRAVHGYLERRGGRPHQAVAAHDPEEELEGTPTSPRGVGGARRR